MVFHTIVEKVLRKALTPAVAGTIAISCCLSVKADEDQKFLAEINEIYFKIHKELDEKPIAGQIRFINELMETYQHNPQAMWLFPQILAEKQSYAGWHQRALATNLLSDSGGSVVELPDLPTSYQAAGAVEYIVSQAKSRQIVMVNEAHHNAQHRVLTYRLLKGLWDSGYRYLAVEQLTENFSNAMGDNYVSSGVGAYMEEPIYGQMIIFAKQLGFKLVAYDFKPSKTTDQREQLAAEVIKQSIFDKNPDAKVIVHCGYSHINEQSWLAAKLKQSTSHNPLTINQTDVAESSDKTQREKLYDKAVDIWPNKTPFVLLSNKGEPWSIKPQEYDLNVIWPRAQYNKNRPNWAGIGRYQEQADLSNCHEQFPCTIEVFETDNPTALASDRYIATSTSQQVDIFKVSPNARIVYNRGKVEGEN